MIIERENFELENIIQEDKILSRYKDNFTIIKNKEYSKMSSTIAKEYLKVKEEQEIVKVIPEKVHKYIKENKLYQ